MKKTLICGILVLSVLIVASCDNGKNNNVSEPASKIVASFVSRNETPSAPTQSYDTEKLGAIIIELCGEGYAPKYKEESILGDKPIAVYTADGERETDWLFAVSLDGGFYIKKEADWRHIGFNDNGTCYIGDSAEITHTDDEYLLVVASLADEIFGKSEERQIERVGSGIFDEYLLQEYSIIDGNQTVGYIALDNTVDNVYIDSGSGEYEKYTGDLDSHRANG